jgi:hypothetical protein
MAHLITMIKPSNGVHSIVMGKHYINSEVAFYVFNSTMPLQAISPHTNSELQLKIITKQLYTTLSAP